MIKSLLHLFQKPLAEEIVEHEIEEYQRQLLEHQASAAYHRKMAEYYGEGLERLKRFTTTRVSQEQ